MSIVSGTHSRIFSSCYSMEKSSSPADFLPSHFRMKPNWSADEIVLLVEQVAEYKAAIKGKLGPRLSSK